ncbi:MAG: hypothetical protein AB1813_12920 [Verrucomicrobiota bacterium]
MRIPFDTLNTGVARSAQIINNYMFEQISGPIAISEIAFRLSSDSLGAGSVQINIDAIEVELSTSPFTANIPERFSNFDALHGPDKQVVFLQGSIHWSTVLAPAGDVNAFDLKIPFTRPFIYDPDKGNLYMDIRVLRSSSSSLFDFHTDTGRRTVDFGYFYSVGLDDQILENLYNGALVTRFTFQVVPEASTVALALIALGSAIFARFARVLSHQGK